MLTSYEQEFQYMVYLAEIAIYTLYEVAIYFYSLYLFKNMKLIKKQVDEMEKENCEKNIETQQKILTLQKQCNLIYQKYKSLANISPAALLADKISEMKK